MQTNERTTTIEQLRERIGRLLGTDGPRYRRLWSYYRNPLRITGVLADENGSDRPYRQAQEWGLPSRITGVRSSAESESSRPTGAVARKDVVIENNIAWRVDAGVDYLFGRPVEIRSTAADESRRAVITRLLQLVVAHNGGDVMLQQLALLGSVYGFVDVAVKLKSEISNLKSEISNLKSETGDEPTVSPAGGDLGCPALESEESAGSLPSDGGSAPAVAIETESTAATASESTDESLQRIARRIRLEIVEPARALPLISSEDWRKVEAYGQVWRMESCSPALLSGGPGRETGATEGKRRSGDRGYRRNWFDWLLPRRRGTDRCEGTVVVELITADRWERWEGDRLIAEGTNSLGVVPVVHIQNLPLPFSYAGLSDVEPLIPLQDELNTRLSDRANRIALQSFKMYLGKGIEGFTDQPVAPGRMWMTDNDEASIQEFGGDANCPSEESHIADLREAMDKISAVTPIAAGAIKDRIGNLTSAAALRITLLALLSKTERKRTTYGEGIGQMCELALAWLDRAGLFATRPDERGVDLRWQSPLPENDMEKLQEAEAKLRLGVSGEIVRRELGYE